MPAESPKQPQLESAALLVTVFVAAVCGLVYELIAGTLSSYLLGDSVTQFSLVIGLFLTAMGIGAYLSKYIQRHLIEALIAIEMAVGVVGGVTAFVGFATFALTAAYSFVLVLLVLLVGILVGMEIPLVIRILREEVALPLTLAHVLSLDYAGALIASLFFPFVLLPEVGLVRGGMLMGLLNVGVALYLLSKVRGSSKRRRRLAYMGGGLSVALVLGIVVAPGATTFFEDQLYQDEIVLAQDTGYQRMVVTRWRDDIRLYLNGHLQFSSVDEYRYHESLVHPAMASAQHRNRVLILGGGDGMAAREVLRYADVDHIDLVDLDPAVTSAFRDIDLFKGLNEGALSDPRVKIHNTDAMRFLESSATLYDIVLMDLPDPSEASLGKLYARSFFELIGRRLTPGGRFAAQCTSPYRSRKAYWSIIQTIEAARFGSPEQPRYLTTYPYHTVVPSFGTWGFVLASLEPVAVEDIEVPGSARYLTQSMLPGLFSFPKDMERVEGIVSSLDDPVVVRLYRDGYNQYFD